MRARTSEFIKVLNRARPEKVTEKKTMRFADIDLISFFYEKVWKYIFWSRFSRISYS